MTFWIVLGSILGLIFTLIVLLIAFDVMTTPSMTDEDILNILSHSVWKTGREIVVEIYHQKNYSTNFGVNTAPIYTKLLNLEEEGYITSRYRTTLTSNELGGMPNYIPREYKLTSKGTRRKNRVPKETSSVIGNWVFVPEQ